MDAEFSGVRLQLAQWSLQRLIGNAATQGAICAHVNSCQEEQLEWILLHFLQRSAVERNR
jgi:hypothetical protein